MDNVSFLAIRNVDASSTIINFTGLNSATIIYDNGTRLTVDGNSNIPLSAGGRMYIINSGDIILSAGLTTYTRFNENSGIIAHDISGNSNNGAISGATWDDDGILITLVTDVDYTISGATYTTINQNNFWSETLTTYTFRKTGVFTAAQEMVQIFLAFPALIGLVGTIILLGLVMAILMKAFVAKPSL